MVPELLPVLELKELLPLPKALLLPPNVLLELLPKGELELVPLLVPFTPPWPAPSIPAACRIWSSIGL